MRHVGILLHRLGVLQIVGGIRQEEFVIEFAVAEVEDQLSPTRSIVRPGDIYSVSGTLVTPGFARTAELRPSRGTTRNPAAGARA